MKTKKIRLFLLLAVVIGVLVWLAISMTRGPITVEERTYKPHELSQALEDLGYTVSTPSYVPDSYQLDRVLVTQFPPQDSNPKQLTLVYKNQNAASYDLVAKELIRPFADEVNVQEFPTDQRSVVEVNGSESVVLTTENPGAKSLRILYAPAAEKMYQINTENRTNDSISENEMISVLESIK
ncbi:hypothetical protein [Glutamicibacter sp. BW77]|uniref:hypothetical protein n=1 Tax=Glutamicibacter TaxID=1742989 RepID=UPI000BB7B01D|nr:hypothetical protein [Glutamicibacter sp. BW77]PCC37107.1 hypothetical protein CIK74_02445 [Glutamicibacter sp. BW77]